MIITLCGSARFEDKFKYWNKVLTLAGHTVFSLAVYPSDEGGKDWYSAEEKLALDRAHIQKIDASEAILIINSGAYIGESTQREVDHAIRIGKMRFYTSIVPNADQEGKRICPYTYCTDKGNIFSYPPCAVCYE